jgi:SPP1 gp7 family putative phage head morphogenesis protein
MGIGWPPSPNAVESEEKFREAIEAIEKRTPVSREEFDRLDKFERENAFTASRVAEARVLQNVLDALQTSVRDGTDFNEFKDSVGAQLVESWGGEIPGRIENIFRTQSMTAYNEGRHTAYSSPAVKAARPYLRFDASMDDRTTDECAECDGVVLPADDPFWATHTPPMHFNALDPDTEILTKDGPKKIKDIHPGDWVLSHRREWKMVTMVLSKRVEGKWMNELQTASGRTIRISDEHPVLVKTSRGAFEWKMAASLLIGDDLVEHFKEMTGLYYTLVSYSDNGPSLGNEPLVPGQVGSLAISAFVDLPVHLDGYPVIEQGEVDDVVSDVELGDSPFPERTGNDGLARCEFLPESFSVSSAGLLPDSVHVHGVARCHPCGNLRTLDPPRPVVGSASLGDDSRIPAGDSNDLLPGHNSDPVLDAPPGNRAIGEVKGPLDVTKTSTLPPVFGSDNGFGLRLGCKYGLFHTSTIVTIAGRPYSGEVYDISVDGDETYIANGLVVHNCRSVLVPLSAEEAGEEGVDDEAPDVDAAEGFGDEPSRKGDDWDFDLSNLDPELRAMVKDDIE